jgi:hypothetical protein
MALFPEGTKAHYDLVARELATVDIPASRRVFIAGESDEGWQVIQVWDRKEDLDTFNERVFLPVLRRLGDLGFPSPPIVRDFHAADSDIRGLLP